MIWFPRFLAFSTGFLSLSQEILWIRLAGFAYQSVPQVFSFVLGMYLIGIAFGAWVGKRLCRHGEESHLVLSAGMILMVGGVFDALAPWLFLPLAKGPLYQSIGALSCLLILTSFFKSVIFPIAHHLGSGIAQNQLGSSVSKVYCSNILGSTTGPLITGFLLLNYFPLQNCMLIMAVLTFNVGVLCFARSRRAVILAVTAVFVAVCLIPALPNVLMPKLILNTPRSVDSYQNFSTGMIGQIIENKHGIIHTLLTTGEDDIVFGGNVYDGRMNIDLQRNSNGINRVYILASARPRPERVLVIGLSGGSWTKVISGFEGVNRIDVVEINSGYLDLIKSYPSHSSLLADPRIRLFIDDGRRWLKRHPDEKYDLIVMNTTYHWRAYSTNLLSLQFLRLLKEHMRQGAVLAYNTTQSLDVFRTAADVFPYVYRYENFVFASEDDFKQKLKDGEGHIAAITIDGHRILDLSLQNNLAAIRETLAVPMTPFAEIERESTRPLEVITDQNMIVEYKYGKMHTMTRSLLSRF